MEGEKGLVEEDEEKGKRGSSIHIKKENPGRGGGSSHGCRKRFFLKCSNNEIKVGKRTSKLTILGRKNILTINENSAGKNVGEEQGKYFGRKAVSFVLITITGGVALSALDDLAIYHGCSSKAMENASKNQAIIDAIGEPIVKGSWYNASLAVAHKRQSVSCSFPVSGPLGSGVVQLKAVRNGEDTWSSFFLARDWDILIMDALLHVPGNEEKHQSLRINLSDKLSPSCTPCTACVACPSEKSEAKLSSNQ